MAEPRVMRDVFLGALHERMGKDRDMFFLTADFGAPALDAMRADFPERAINVGIAEQNLINIAAGLALEGCTVYAYAIAPFLTMRAFEQIRTNLSLLSEKREVNVNLIGVGAGLSYDLSGPTHHCLEDVTVMRALPHIVLFSPSDSVLLERFVSYSAVAKKPKYLRLDGKPLADIYKESEKIDFEAGFAHLRIGHAVCIVSTGFMTHRALAVAEKLAKEGIEVGVIDLFMLKTVARDLLSRELEGYEGVLTLEEGFVGKGGLDSLVLNILTEAGRPVRFKGLGFEDSYVCDVGNRAYLHKLAFLDEAAVAERVKKLAQRIL
jgi:transketolase